MVAGDEAEQVYVHPAFRGTGVAGLLLTEAERQIADAGHDVAWLAVVRGNDRAQAFYARQGWADEGDLDYPVTALGATFISPCRRFATRGRWLSPVRARRPPRRPARWPPRSGRRCPGARPGSGTTRLRPPCPGRRRSP